MRKYYIVGNRAFNTFCQAYEYCEENDFDGETMITEVTDGERAVNYYDTKKHYNIGYVKPDTTLKTVYTIEYISNKTDFERVCEGMHPAPWELYQKYQTEDLQQAITVFLMHYASTLTYDVKLFEEIFINGELIREQCMTDIMNFENVCTVNHARLTDVIHSKDEIISILTEKAEEAATIERRYGREQYKKLIDSIKENASA